MNDDDNEEPGKVTTTTTNISFTWYKQADELTNFKIEELKSNYNLHFEQNEFELALECLETLTAFGPFKDDILNHQIQHKWKLCHYKIAKILWFNRLYTQSVKHWKAILSKDLTKASVYYYIALYYFVARKKYDKAKEFIKKAICLKPHIIKYQQILDEIEGNNILSIQHNVTEWNYNNNINNNNMELQDANIYNNKEGEEAHQNKTKQTNIQTKQNNTKP